MKKYFSLSCILALLALVVAVLFLRTSSDTADAPEMSEGETDMTYRNNGSRRITPSQAWAKIQANPEAIILDVRTQEEFATEHIPGAVLLPDYAVKEQALYVLPDKNALILVYCRSGARSQGATNALVSMGYTNVYDFGGINSWPYERE